MIREKTETDSRELDRLIERVAMGDAAALETLYCAKKAAVYGFALSILKNAQDAEDVLHDCFVSIYNAAPSYRKEGKAKTWIMTIAHNLCMQKLRERSRRSDLPEEEWEPFLEQREGVTPEDKVVLEKCMSLLSEEERNIVILHAVSGFKHREIAEMLHLPLPTVLSKYNRALKKLKESL